MTCSKAFVDQLLFGRFDQLQKLISVAERELENIVQITRIPMKKAMLGLAAAVVVSGLPALTSTAAADPSCITSANATSSDGTVTVRVSSNPCSRQVRAWVECVAENGVKTQRTGSAISGTGSASVSCGFAYVNRKGHEVNVPGQGWTRYVY
ncbi:hypothetical protein [Streptomyces sp. NBC_00096]|uniref:hypothetical protein n=1 Tax=Streptomyces sp. NBC_00096 TaxID=2975650 RepID=UPI003249A115